jgi:beta-aspartyl-dipeptidase (metallo-type)
MSFLLLRNAEVWDPQPLGRRDLLVGGGQVLWMGEAGTAPAVPGTERDMEGRPLVPGLIDGHAHLCGGGGEAGFRTRVPRLHLTDLTLAGVTSAVGVLGTDDLARSPRELLATAYALEEEGLSVWAWTGGYHLPPVTLCGSVRADIAFVPAFIGVGEVAISDHRSSQPTLDELLRLGSEAHVAGLMTGKAGVVHLHLGDGPRGLALVREALDRSELPPRTWLPTHVNRRKALFDEAVALAERGCVIDITAFPVEEGEDAWSAAEAVVRYLDSGAPRQNVTVSSDAGGCLPRFDDAGRVTSFDVGRSGALLQTIQELRTRGLSLVDAVAPFTANVADALRLPGKGRIRVGGDADLVALDEDGAAAFVVARGRLVVERRRAVVWGSFEGERIAAR